MALPQRPQDVLLRTKVTPPRLPRRALSRPALRTRLLESLDYRLTLVQAGTGYGKSTALAALDAGDQLLIWYSVGEADADPQHFLSYLIAACAARLPQLSEQPLALLQERGDEDNQVVCRLALDALINAVAAALPGPTLLVLDDYHFAAGSPEIVALVDRLIDYLPPDLHVILSTRHPVGSPAVARWRSRGEVLEIDSAALAFRPAEIEELFRQIYGIQLAPREVASLAEKTEGWPIALQLVWQGLRDGPSRSAADLLADGPASLAALFDYLARDVYERQPPDIAAFLRETAVLRELTPAACDAVIDSRPPTTDGRPEPTGGRSSAGGGRSSSLLSRLHDLDLFIVVLGEQHYRYHYLFHEFLRQLAAADPEATRERNRRAAAYFRAAGDAEQTIHHLLAAGEHAAAAREIEQGGETALKNGRLDTVAGWIDALPPETLADHPLLQVYLGDIYRMRSAFERALAWYAQAEEGWRARGDLAGVARALRGQARVYLDTVQPARAESLLQESLRLSDGVADRESRARLLDLMAENKLNMGDPEAAERLRNEARVLREDGPGEDVLSVRVKLRTGRLDEAQQILEGWAEVERRAAERGSVHPPRSHRETVLLLSLIHSLRGQSDRAVALAREGIALGERLGSPFVTAVAQTRLGHALQLNGGDEARGGELAGSSAAVRPAMLALQPSFAEAIQCYQASIALGDRLSVRRIRAEALWGLTRAYGFAGDLESAERAAAEGADVARSAGDPWVAALVDLALGAGYVLAGRAAAAADVFSRVLMAFGECGDSFGRAATRLWLSLTYLELRQGERFAACVADALALCETHGYDELLVAATLLGPPDPRRMVPALLEARARRIRPTYVSRILAALGMPEIQQHPGYRLSVQTLGAFRVWRGDAEVEAREWQRDKARQLFQLLITGRGRWLQRDEIVDRLWPDLSPDAASRDFKVALSALNKAIEPGRPPDAPFAFIVREGSAYRLRPEADLWLDAAAFEQAAVAGLRAERAATVRLQEALQLYRGDFLPDALYEDWAADERERLLALYLQAADRLAELLVDGGRYDEAIATCRRILASDRCWERAYRLMMLAYARQENRPLALRAYERCVRTLRDELGVEPSQATVQLHWRILHGDPEL